jgi:prophage DNA circulation protein
LGWKERLRPEIVLQSPEENIFRAFWRENDVSVEKRVNRVAHPDRDGESFQDLGINSFNFPLTFYFSGPDCDLEAARFSASIPEKGVWEVTHPILGLLRLQPVKFTFRLSPVGSGNVIEITSDWFAPAEDTRAPSPDYAVRLKDAVSALSDAALSDAARITSKVEESVAAKQTVAQRFRRNLNMVKGDFHAANARLAAMMSTINDFTLQRYLDVASLSGAVIQLFESPGLFAGNVASRVSMFARLGYQIIADLFATVAAFGGSSSGGISARGLFTATVADALTGELWLNAVACGIGTTVTESLPETRAEALSVLTRYQAAADASRASLDALAKAAAALPVEEQYFPRAASAEAVLTLNAAVARYILNIAFSLRTEKRIVLAKPENPMMLAIREYGASAANADAAFDLLCRSNNLHGKNLLLMDRGREIVIYQ